ncbi:hypothetical protein QVD17_10246 [Tagetes erecta]|uniref:Galactose oxidase, beta-propeller n=1 Tax=Tagetes erecta TaxID=13708 RepID=A0AAD8P651_TARER|nr:hypothetical protein QVD17_10246 [Tagetes erecta]
MSSSSSSSVSNKCNEESDGLGHITNDVIETLASQLENVPLGNNKFNEDGNLAPSLAHDGSPIASPDQTDDLETRQDLDQVITHWVYFSCHELKWEAFNPNSKEWMNLPIIMGDICFQLSDKESIAVGTELLVLGKCLSGHAVYKYNLLTNSWSEGQLMNKPRCLFGSASLGNIAIFAGGVSRSGKMVNEVEAYDSETGAWEMLPSLLKPRGMSSGVFMDGKFYVIGGCSGPDMKPLSCGEEYDLVAKQWKVIPDMSPGGGGGSMAPPLLAVVDNELYAADYTTMEVKKYDKTLNVWECIGLLPKRAANVSGWGIAFKGCGDRVIIVAGPRAYGNTHVEIYAWAPKEGPPQWSMLGRKKANNFVYNCAVMSR